MLFGFVPGMTPITDDLTELVPRSAPARPRPSASASLGGRFAAPRAFGGRRSEIEALEITNPLGAQQFRVLGALDAFGHRAQPEALGEADQMTQKDLVFRAVGKVLNKRPIDLHDVDRESLQVPQRGVPGAKVIERDAAARMTQRVDEAGRLFDIIESRGFGDFDDEPGAE